MNGDAIEAARDLAEQIVLGEVAAGTDTAHEEELTWSGPTREPFLTLWANGWRKWKARHEWASGRVIVVHFWRSPTGERAHLKIKED